MKGGIPVGNARTEDLEMKIPALLHLSRLGFFYLSRDQLRFRDRKTNILPDVLMAAAERINGATFSAERCSRLMEDLQALLDAEDLGKAFYGTVRDGWEGVRLIDFKNPENNLFQSAAELSCGSGAGSFRPDITLFVNGLPLAMIEVKTGARPRGLQAEYDRMLERSRGEGGRRYLQCAQVWAFSDGRGDEPDRLLPMDGAFFAAVMTDGFPLHTLRGGRAVLRRTLTRNEEEERRILKDAGIGQSPHTLAFRRGLSPEKPAHRMLTALFSPERFLFLLRYGIRYMRETDPAGKEYLTRRMLTIPQLSALRSLPGKAARGWLNWTLPPFGAAGEQAVNASLAALLRDLAPEARLYWVSADEEELRRDLSSLRSCGVSCAPREGAAEAQLKLLTAVGDPQGWLGEAGEREFTGPRVFVLPRIPPRYGQKGSFPARLRRADPGAVLVTRNTERAPEGGGNVAILLAAGAIPGS